MTGVIPTAELAALVRAACRLDVEAFKPGNVSITAQGHGMTAADFLDSAEAISVPITAPGSSVGERVRLAVEATISRTGQNTNLGIVLMLAPLVKALQEQGGDYRTRLERVLDSMTVADTRAVFEAIRIAGPAGLGRSETDDVFESARRPLREVMAVAADRDQIAAQYAGGFELVFEHALPEYERIMGENTDSARAMVGLYLFLLENFLDSHVRRKHGDDVARAVRLQASEARREYLLNSGESREAVLVDLDRRWKSSGINPGTTADLSVATCFLRAALARESQDSKAGRPRAGRSWNSGAGDRVTHMCQRVC